MDTQREIKLLRDRIDEGEQVIAGDANFTEWKSKSRLVLAMLYGDDGSLGAPVRRRVVPPGHVD